MDIYLVCYVAVFIKISSKRNIYLKNSNLGVIFPVSLQKLDKLIYNFNAPPTLWDSGWSLIIIVILFVFPIEQFFCGKL